MMRYATAAVTALVLLLPAGAAAQGSEAPASDPEADTPSGTIYELPLDRGRRDAAPRRRGPSNGPGDSSRRGEAPVPNDDTSGGGTDSPIRSENNFGSSSEVPGVDDDGPELAGGPGGPGPGGTGDDGGGDGRTGSSAGSGAATAAIDDDPASSANDGPAWSLIVSLIALLLLLGISAGTLAGRTRRE